MSLSYEELQQQLKTYYYAQVPFPLDKSAIEEAVQAFMDFLDLPDEIKNTIDFTIAPKHRRGDVGFKHRDADDGIYDDSKDFFHYHPALHERYPEYLATNPVVNDFITKAKVIWDMVYKTTDEILTVLDTHHPDIKSKIMDTNDVHILLRFLRYDWVNSGKYLAKPHFDAGAFTLAIAESCPGLRVGSNPDNMQFVNHEERKAIFMLSSNYKKVIDTQEFLPGWHDVVQLQETNIGKPFSRWAVVAFIEAHNVEALSRTETHKWYKEDVA